MHFEQATDARGLAKYYSGFGLEPDSPQQWLVLSPDELAQLQDEAGGLLARMLAMEPRNFTEFAVAHRDIEVGEERQHSFALILNLDAPVPGRHTMEFCRANARTDLEKEFSQALQTLCAQAVRQAHPGKRA